LQLGKKGQIQFNLNLIFDRRILILLILNNIVPDYIRDRMFEISDTLIIILILIWKFYYQKYS